MNKKFWYMIFLLFLISIGCSFKLEPPSVRDIKLSEPASQEASKPSWQIVWEKTQALARKEGKVVIYTGGAVGRAKDAIIKVLKTKFGLEAEITSGTAAGMSAKIAAERRAGLYIVDVYISAAKRLLQTDKPLGSLDPLEPALILPEVLDGNAWWGGQLKWVDKDRTILILLLYVSTPMAINTTLVQPEEIASWRGLLNPKWKEKIVMDDPTAGGTSSSLIFALGEGIMDWDFVRQLAKQEPVIVRDRRLILEWLARGRYPISLMATGAVEFIQAGAPVKEIIPQEGSYLSTASGSIALINKAPHPNAAGVFINWLLSKEGQTLFSQAIDYPSARLDVPKDIFDQRRIIQPGVKYLLSDTEELLMKRIHFEQVVVRQIFSDLIK